MVGQHVFWELNYDFLPHYCYNAATNRYGQVTLHVFWELNYDILPPLLPQRSHQQVGSGHPARLLGAQL